jgi:hypothetical protein
MLADQSNATEGVESLESEGTDAMLRRFILSSAAAKMAAGSLRDGAEAAVRFTDVPGDWRFYVEGGKPFMEATKAKDPDFDLHLSPGAVRSICTHTEAHLGELGIAFFERVVTREPDYRIQVQLHSGMLKLAQRGWLTLLARGGPSLASWLAVKGFRGSTAVVAALARLRRAP